MRIASKPGTRLGAIATAVTLTAALPSPASAQSDNDVRWSGISHVPWADRRPRVPRNGESFQVRFQALRGDLTSARVRIDDGAIAFAGAAVVGVRGPYDLWSATVPATASSTLRYVLELTDGSDTDYFSAAGMTDDLATAIPFELNFTTLSHAPVGATPVSGGVVFKVWSPSRTTAHVRGQFNSWGLTSPLTRVGEHFIGFVPGALAGQRYKYYFNNSTWATDARAAALVPTDSYNSVIVNQDAYTWQAPEFTPPPLERMVVYQLHVGSFAGRNDPAGTAPSPSRFIDVAARAPALADLGVNAVMLNPVNEFPGDFSGGYNTIIPWALESKLGTPDQFKQMVDALHQAGIAVLLDVVWNHVSPADNVLWNYDGTQLYFDSPAVDTPWGAQPDFDKAGVREYYLDSAELMLGEYRLDGFRVDATMYLTDSGLTPQWSSGQAFIRAMNDLRSRRHADKHTIAELYIDSAWATNPTPSGLGFSAQYQNEFKEAVRSAIFAAASGDPNMQRIANVLDGQGAGVAGSSVLNYFELHDDCWPLNGHQRAVRTIDPSAPHDDAYARGRTIVGQSLNLLSRGVPALVQGTEWLEDDGWEASKIDWSHKTTYAGVFAYYRDLIRLRTTEPALFANAPLFAYHVNDPLNVMAFERSQIGGKAFVAAVSLGNSARPAYRIGVPRDGRWLVRLNSADAAYGGPGSGPSSGTPVPVEQIASGIHPRSIVLDLPPHSVILLEHAFCVADFNASGSVTVQDIFDFLAAYFASDPAADVNGQGGVTVQDIFDYLALYFSGC